MDIQLASRSAVRDFIAHLEQQGFKAHQVAHQFTQSKITTLINSANVLQLDIHDNTIIEKLKLSELDSFEEMRTRLEVYFGAFGKEDKIMELVRRFYPIYTARIIVPGKNSDPYSHSLFQKEMTKYGITAIPKTTKGTPVEHMNVYMLKPGNKIKVCFNRGQSLFGDLIKLIYEKDIPIVIKRFANGNADIKGDLEELRQYYLRYLKADVYNVVLT